MGHIHDIADRLRVAQNDVLDLERQVQVRDATIAQLREDKAALSKRVGELEDWTDLMVDEFCRIKACPAATQEINGVCERAITQTKQNVPLIEQRDKAESIVRKLPRTADGVPVVPGFDPIWIDPHETGGWMGEDPGYGSWDENDHFIPSGPIQIKSWSWHGDHCWVLPCGGDEGTHWQGRFYSSSEAVFAARQATAEEGGGDA